MERWLLSLLKNRFPMNKVEPPVIRRLVCFKEEEGFLFAQREKIRRVHRLVLMGDAEMDVAAQRGLHQSGVAHIADDLSCAHCVPGLAYRVR